MVSRLWKELEMVRLEVFEEFWCTDIFELWQELRHAKDLLEETLEVEVPYVAYPWGNTTDAVTQMVKDAGYQLAFTTRKKKLTSNNIDLLRIPRVTWSRRATLFKLSKYYLIPWLRSAG